MFATHVLTIHLLLEVITVSFAKYWQEILTAVGRLRTLASNIANKRRNIINQVAGSKTAH
jgi:hypothetical protein